MSVASPSTANAAFGSPSAARRFSISQVFKRSKRLSEPCRPSDADMLDPAPAPPPEPPRIVEDGARASLPSSRTASPEPASPTAAPLSRSPPVRRRGGGHGELSLALSYNKYNEQLVVGAAGVRGLAAAAGADLYLRLYILSDGSRSRRKTATVKRTTLVEWAEPTPPFRVRATAVKDEILCVQVMADNGDDAPLAEAFVALGNVALSTQSRTTTYQLHPPQDRRRHSRMARTSVKKRSVVGGAGSEMEEMAALLSWLSEQAFEKEDDAVVARLVEYRDRPWASFNASVGTLRGRAQKHAEALWELFTSECAHLSTLQVLRSPFKELLQRAVEVAQSGNDARVPSAFRDIDVVKLFGNIEDLHAISLQFALELESIYVTAVRVRRQSLQALAEDPSEAPDDARARISDEEKRQTGSLSLPPVEGASSRISLISCEIELFEDNDWLEANFIEPVIQAVRTMKTALMAPELQYRLQQHRARKYLNTLLQEHEMFAYFLEWCEEDSRCCRMNFKDLLVQPLQRLTRYPLLLKAIAKETTASGLRSSLLAAVRELEKEIEQQNIRVSEREMVELVRRIELSIIWPAAAQLNTTAFIPDSLKSLLTETPHVSFKSMTHRLQRRGANRLHLGVHEGWLYPVARNGKVGERLYGFLLDDIFFLTSPIKSAALPSGDSFEPKKVVDGPYHLSELQVYDLSDDAKVQDAFAVVFLDGFGNPRNFYTLRADSVFEKTDWLRSLNAGISRATEDVKLFEQSGGSCRSGNGSLVRRTSKDSPVTVKSDGERQSPSLDVSPRRQRLSRTRRSSGADPYGSFHASNPGGAQQDEGGSEARAAGSGDAPMGEITLVLPSVVVDSTSARSSVTCTQELGELTPTGAGEPTPTATTAGAPPEVPVLELVGLVAEEVQVSRFPRQTTPAVPTPTCESPFILCVDTVQAGRCSAPLTRRESADASQLEGRRSHCGEFASQQQHSPKQSPLGSPKQSVQQEHPTDAHPQHQGYHDRLGQAVPQLQLPTIGIENTTSSAALDLGALAAAAAAPSPATVPSVSLSPPLVPVIRSVSNPEFASSEAASPPLRPSDGLPTPPRLSADESIPPSARTSDDGPAALPSARTSQDGAAHSQTLGPSPSGLSAASYRGSPARIAGSGRRSLHSARSTTGSFVNDRTLSSRRGSHHVLIRRTDLGTDV